MINVLMMAVAAMIPPPDPSLHATFDCLAADADGSWAHSFHVGARSDILPPEAPPAPGVAVEGRSAFVLRITGGETVSRMALGSAVFDEQNNLLVYPEGAHANRPTLRISSLKGADGYQQWFALELSPSPKAAPIKGICHGSGWRGGARRIDAIMTTVVQ